MESNVQNMLSLLHVETGVPNEVKVPKKHTSPRTTIEKKNTHSQC